MKKIKITSFTTTQKIDGLPVPSELADTITAALHAVNGKATSHTFTHGCDVLDALKGVSIRLEKMLGGKKYLPGAVVYLESGSSVANAYKYTRIGSVVKCVCRSSAWYITEIKCCELYKAGGNNRVEITEEQDARAVAVLRTNYRIIAK